jgi:hypothetical protein
MGEFLTKRAYIKQLLIDPKLSDRDRVVLSIKGRSCKNKTEIEKMRKLSIKRNHFFFIANTLKLIMNSSYGYNLLNLGTLLL